MKDNKHEDLSSVQIEEVLDNVDRPSRHNINPMNRPSRVVDPAYKIADPICQTAEQVAEEQAWIELDEKLRSQVNQADNNGGMTKYYELPHEAKDLQDLIEAKEMNFAVGNIFKATYRLNEKHHSNRVRELNKIIWFAQRELKLALSDENM